MQLKVWLTLSDFAASNTDHRVFVLLAGGGVGGGLPVAAGVRLHVAADLLELR